jgi:hypothetical protein
MDAGLKNLICRRRLDFVDVQASLERKLSIKRWRLLEAGLNDLENLSNNGKSDKEDMNATFDKLMHDCEAAIAGFSRPLVVAAWTSLAQTSRGLLACLPDSKHA